MSTDWIWAVIYSRLIGGRVCLCHADELRTQTHTQQLSGVCLPATQHSINTLNTDKEPFVPDNPPVSHSHSQITLTLWKLWLMER